MLKMDKVTCSLSLSLSSRHQGMSDIGQNDADVPVVDVAGSVSDDVSSCLSHMYSICAC